MGSSAGAKVEIVTNGQRGWVERSQTLYLNNDEADQRQG